MRAIVGCPDPGSEKRHSIAYVRPQAILPSLAFARLASDLPGPKTRAAIWSGSIAWTTQKGSRIGFRHSMFLQTQPDWRGKVTYLQIAPKSRTEIPEYADMEQEIGSAAGRINGAYGEADWTPIRYVNRAYSHSTLAAIAPLVLGS